MRTIVDSTPERFRVRRVGGRAARRQGHQPNRRPSRIDEARGHVARHSSARALGVPDTRITTIAALVDGITPTSGANAAPGALEKLARLIVTGRLRVPIAARFPLEQIRTAVELQAGQHVKGKVVIDL
jgi:NADPH:quinone reductase-like Zn-dependent oxidoreductase